MEEARFSRFPFLPKSPYKTTTMFRKPPSAKFRVDEMIGYINYEYPTKRPKKRPIPRFCYVCCRTSPYKHLYADPYASCPHFTSGPHPSFVSEVELRRDFGGPSPQDPGDSQRISESVEEDEEQDRDDGEGYEGAHFDTSVLALNDEEDPNQFALPPMFNTAATTTSSGKKKSKRVVPSVSEKTFVSSNYRSEEGFDDDDNDDNNDDDNDNDSYDYSEHRRSSKASFGKAGEDRQTSHGEDGRLRFPDLHPGSNLVTAPWADERGANGRLKEQKVKFADLQNDPEGNQSLSSRSSRSSRDFKSEENDLDPSLTFRSDPGVHRTMTLESEPTGASLHIDEDYIPMSVTIKKLAEVDVLERGYSDYNEYSDVLSSSLSGSLGVSRETSLGSCSPSPTGFMNKLREASWPVYAQRKRASRHADGSEKLLDTVSDLTTSQIPHSAKCQEKLNKKEHSRRKHKSKQNRESDEIKTAASTSEKLMAKSLQRVRFSDTIQQVSPDNQTRLPKTALNYQSLENFDHDSAKYNKAEKMSKEFESYKESIPGLGWAVMEEREVSEEEAAEIERRQKRRPKSLDDFRIPNLGVNVHKMAYMLALQDARMKEGTSKKKSKSKKGAKDGETKSQGTVFSYFPLLHRSRSESLPDVNIGIRQKAGRSVKLKNAMKHIFGNVKFGEYYPGGSKFRKIKV